MSATELLLLALVVVILVVIALQVAVLLRGRGAEKARSDAESRWRETLSQLAYAQAQAERAVAVEKELRAAQEDLSARRAELAGMSSQHDAAARNLMAANGQIAALTAAGKSLAEEKSALLESQARLEQEVKSARQREVDTSKLLTDAKEEMAKEFKLMASTLLEEKGAKLNEQQKATLSDLLRPFSKTLDDFRGKVEATREADLTAREGLIAQIRHLTELNQDIGAKAQSLTNALRGESKTRGMWGEAVLQRILELAGLREGAEFRTQVSHQGDEAEGRLIPDVVLDLPQERAIVIDAKVSLVAYERYVSAADDEPARTAALEDPDDVAGVVDERRAARPFGSEEPNCEDRRARDPALLDHLSLREADLVAERMAERRQIDSDCGRPTANRKDVTGRRAVQTDRCDVRPTDVVSVARGPGGPAVDRPPTSVDEDLVLGADEVRCVDHAEVPVHLGEDHVEMDGRG